MEVELHAGTLAPSASTAAALGMTGVGGTKGGRPKTGGAVDSAARASDGIGTGGVGVGGGVKQHPGMLSESEESRVKSRGGKVRVWRLRHGCGKEGGGGGRRGGGG